MILTKGSELSARLSGKIICRACAYRLPCNGQNSVKDRSTRAKAEHKNATHVKKKKNRSGDVSKEIRRMYGTSSELDREDDGLVTHFAKHLSFVFYVTLID